MPAKVSRTPVRIATGCAALAGCDRRRARLQRQVAPSAAAGASPSAASARGRAGPGSRPRSRLSRTARARSSCAAPSACGSSRATTPSGSATSRSRHARRVDAHRRPAGAATAVGRDRAARLDLRRLRRAEQEAAVRPGGAAPRPRRARARHYGKVTAPASVTHDGRSTRRQEAGRGAQREDAAKPKERPDRPDARADDRPSSRRRMVEDKPLRRLDQRPRVRRDHGRRRQYWKIDKKETSTCSRSDPPHTPSLCGGARLGDDTGLDAADRVRVAARAERRGVRRTARRSGGGDRAAARRAHAGAACSRRPPTRPASRPRTASAPANGLTRPTRAVHRRATAGADPAGERWIDVDVDAQTWSPTRATARCTRRWCRRARKATPTETGLYRIWKKVVRDRHGGPQRRRGSVLGRDRAVDASSSRPRRASRCTPRTGTTSSATREPRLRQPRAESTRAGCTSGATRRCRRAGR